MPCITEQSYQKPDDVSDAWGNVGCAVTKLAKLANDYKREANKVTNILCEVLGEIEYQRPCIILSNRVKEWWEKHKEFDTARNK